MSKFLFIVFIASFAIFLFPLQMILASSGLIINEIMYDAPGTDDKHEWIELHNAGSSEIDLTDFKFNDGSNHILNPPPANGSRGSLTISAGGYLILSGNASTTILDMPNYDGSIIDTVMSLNNTTATLKILNKDGAEISSASYAKEMGANGNGKTLSWDGTGFKESATEGGTPGKENIFSSQPNIPNSPNIPNQSSPNSTSTESVSQNINSSQSSFNNFSDKIFINEFMPWPIEGKEWVELINIGTETIDLSNWQLDDKLEESPAQNIPDGTLIEPSKFLVVEMNKNVLNNDSDQLRLLWPDDQPVHAVTFKSAKQGFSSSRFESGLWLWTNNPTPGAENRKSALISSPQKSSVQNIQPASPKINPLIETTQETAVPPKQPRPATNPSLSSSNNDKLTAVTPDQSTPSPANITAAAVSAPFLNQPSLRSSGLKILLSLAIIFVLSLAASLGLIYFRRKRSPS